MLRYRAFKDQIRIQAGKYQPHDGDTVVFYLPMPKSWSKTKKAAHYGEPHRQKPDLDNLLKAFWDVFGEDCQLAHVTARKLWAKQGQVVVIPA